MGECVVCAGTAESACIERWLAACEGVADARVVGDPLEVRERLRGGLRGSRVVVGEGLARVSPVNLAAALVADGCAQEVRLVAEAPSGSLLSRASRAGVDGVVPLEDVAAASDRAWGAEEGGPGPAIGRDRDLERADGSGRAGAGGTAGAPDDRRDPPARNEDVPVVAFVSGRGGVGKTTMVALFGYVAAAWGLKVAMLDLDLAFGNLAALCGADETADLVSLAEGGVTPEDLERCRFAAADRLGVWGPCRMPEYAEVVAPAVEGIVAALTQGHDLVLVDTSTSWGDVTAQAAQLANRLVIVSDERPGAIPALARCGSLAVRLGVARTRVVRLMNGCDPRGRDESFVARAAVGLECSRELRVVDGGADAVELLSCGRAADLADLDVPLVASLSHGLAQLLQELGCLPECEGATRALAGEGRARRRFSLLGRERP